jgi:hypothetical protein
MRKQRPVSAWPKDRNQKINGIEQCLASSALMCIIHYLRPNNTFLLCEECCSGNTHEGASSDVDSRKVELDQRSPF